MSRRKCWFARWTSDYDCGVPTQWWYCVRDEKISLESLTAKQRYRVKRGFKNMEIRKVDPHEYGEQLYEVLKASLADYPDAYRRGVRPYAEFAKEFEVSHGDWFIAVSRENGSILGFSTCHRGVEMAHLTVVKVRPEFLNLDVNAALGYFIVEHYINHHGCRYICDGARNIRHMTNYQEYLVHNLGFRYAYCRLNVIYSKSAWIAVNLLYPFRRLIKACSGKVPLLYSIYCILKQEEIARSFRS